MTQQMKVSTLPDQKAKLSSSKVLTAKKVFSSWQQKKYFMYGVTKFSSVGGKWYGTTTLKRDID